MKERIMKINFNEPFVDLSNEPIIEKTQIGKETKDVTIILKAICTTALLALQEKENLSGEEKVKRYELAKRIFAGGEINLKTEQIVLLKDLIGKSFTPIIVGQAFRMLEGKRNDPV